MKLKNESQPKKNKKKKLISERKNKRYSFKGISFICNNKKNEI